MPIPTAARTKFTFTHIERVIFPEKGYTKGDLLEYYLKVAPKLIPHLRGRPLTLERLPDGLTGEGAPHFWQKNTPATYPDYIERVRIPDQTGKPVDYALVNDARALMYLVNQGTMTFHVFLSRVDSLDRPDYVLFDLDPGERPFGDAVKVAKAVKSVLDARGATAYAKTSGKSGIHVLTPWRSKGDHAAARAWALEVAEEVVQAMPDVATLERRIKSRGGRLYLDVMQNARGHHVVPPYVVRATPDATVSTPVGWSEVNARLRPGRFDLRSAAKRFEGEKDPMAPLTRTRK